VQKRRKEKSWWKRRRKKLRKFSTWVFLILEAKGIPANWSDKDSLHLEVKREKDESVPVWLLVDKGLSCECFWSRELLKIYRNVMWSLHNDRSINRSNSSRFTKCFNCGVKRENKEKESRPNSFQVLCFYRDRGCCERLNINVIMMQLVVQCCVYFLKCRSYFYSPFST